MRPNKGGRDVQVKIQEGLFNDLSQFGGDFGGNQDEEVLRNQSEIQDQGNEGRSRRNPKIKIEQGERNNHTIKRRITAKKVYQSPQIAQSDIINLTKTKLIAKSRYEREMRRLGQTPSNLKTTKVGKYCLKRRNKGKQSPSQQIPPIQSSNQKVQNNSNRERGVVKIQESVSINQHQAERQIMMDQMNGQRNLRRRCESVWRRPIMNPSVPSQTSSLSFAEGLARQKIYYGGQEMQNSYLMEMTDSQVQKLDVDKIRKIAKMQRNQMRLMRDVINQQRSKLGQSQSQISNLNDRIDDNQNQIHRLKHKLRVSEGQIQCLQQAYKKALNELGQFYKSTKENEMKQQQQQIVLDSNERKQKRIRQVPEKKKKLFIKLPSADSQSR